MVYLGEDPVELLLVGPQVIEPFPALCLPVGEAFGQQSVSPSRGGQQGVALEVPGGLEGVPVGAGEGDAFINNAIKRGIILRDDYW